MASPSEDKSLSLSKHSPHTTPTITTPRPKVRDTSKVRDTYTSLPVSRSRGGGPKPQKSHQGMMELTAAMRKLMLARFFLSNLEAKHAVEVQQARKRIADLETEVVDFCQDVINGFNPTVQLKTIQVI
jgi:hypothetical protein